jgi:hypothetical protein
MPSLIKDKLDVHIDSTNQAPFAFSTFIPPGPACRSALMGGHASARN